MKVILLQDVRNLGRRWEVKDVNDGYARNFLLAKKLALAATPENLAKRGQLIANEERGAANLKTLSERLKKEMIEFKIKTGKNGEVFESVTKERIIEELKRRGYPVQKIELEKPLRELGVKELKVSFGNNINGTFKILIN